jgi:hypothetical protein
MQEPNTPTEPSYPVRFAVEYQDQLSRLATFFRIIFVIPVLLFVAILTSGSSGSGNEFGDRGEEGFFISLGALGSFVACHWIVILIRKRPAVWIYETIVHIERFVLRAGSYALLLVDKYPAFEGDWFVHYEVDRPAELTRWKIFIWKFITAIPHFIILLALFFAVIVVTIIAWFAILFTGHYPRGLHEFTEGTMRWNARVSAYFISLTDEYPPFSLT